MGRGIGNEASPLDYGLILGIVIRGVWVTLPHDLEAFGFSDMPFADFATDDRSYRLGRGKKVWHRASEKRSVALNHIYIIHRGRLECTKIAIIF